MQEITLPNSPTGRKVLKGLNPFDAGYVGRLLGHRSMAAPRFAPPARCLQSGQYYLDMYWNSKYGCCTGSALVEIINLVYGVKVTEAAALAWFKAHRILNGANELDVLTWAETDPVVVDGKPYVIGPSVTLNYSDPQAIMSAIAANKVVYWGIDSSFLEKCVGDVSGWVAPITRNLTNYDHAVFSPDYGTLDECATYLNKERGVTVTIGSLDPKMLCVTLDTWGTLGLVPMLSADGTKKLTICNTTGEAHTITDFPSAPIIPNPEPPPAPVIPPAPMPDPSLQDPPTQPTAGRPLQDIDALVQSIATNGLDTTGSATITIWGQTIQVKDAHAHIAIGGQP